MLRCLLTTVGKDAPGVNALIRAGTRLALRSDMEVYGAKRGFLGILQDEFHKMMESDVGFIINRGGSLLGSSDFRIERMLGRDASGPATTGRDRKGRSEVTA